MERIEKDGIVTYTVSDSSGNETKVEKTIVSKDVVPPVIKLKGTETMYLVVNDTFKDPGFTAADDCDGDLTESVIVEGKVDTSKTGTYKITYKVKDSSDGNGKKIVYLTFDDGPGKSK